MPHQPRDFQIRLREHSYERVTEVLGWYFTDKMLIFRHEPNPDNIHYHIYLFQLYRTDEAIRDQLRKYYTKTAFMVSTKCGKYEKKPITPEGAYQYASNPKSKPVLVSAKGFTDEELAKFKDDSDKYYYQNLPIVATESDSNVKEVIFKVDRVWERLKKDISAYDGKSVRQIKSSIASDWLNQGKAIPRPSDLHRYAVSLFYLNKHKDEDCVPEDALLAEY